VREAGVQIPDRSNLTQHCKRFAMVVVLPDPFRGMGAWRNSTKTKQSGHAPKFAPMSRRLNVVMRSLPLFPRGGPKWRDNYPEGPDHLVVLNRYHRFDIYASSCVALALWRRNGCCKLITRFDIIRRVQWKVWFRTAVPEKGSLDNNLPALISTCQSDEAHCRITTKMTHRARKILQAIMFCWILQ